MKKYYLLLAAGALGCALASLPVLASDAPTDEGNYIWQDDWMQYQKEHGIYATMLTAKGYGDEDSRFDLYKG